MEPELLLERLYAAFNGRDVNTVLAAMHPDVDWPNGWEGGRLTGREAVRGYWMRQWAELDPSVTPHEFRREVDGRLAVKVHQRVTDKAGTLIGEGEVEHVYTFEDGLVRAMEIR